MQIFLNDQQRLLMNRYMQARIEHGAAKEYERHLRAGIDRLEDAGRTEEAQGLRKKLSPRTEEISDTDITKAVQVVQIAARSGKLKL